MKKLTLSLCAGLLVHLGTNSVHAQIFVSNLNYSTIGEYDATTGTTINASLVSSGLYNPQGIAISGNDLFVCTGNSNNINEYNATTGAQIGTGPLVSHTDAVGLAISGNDLFTANRNNNTIGEYNATTGAPIGTGTLISGISSGLYEPTYLAISGNDLFVANAGNANINEYNATTGAPIGTGTLVYGNNTNPTDPTALHGVGGIAISGNDLFVSDGINIIHEYNATTGAPVGTDVLVSGLAGCSALAISGNDLFVAYNGGSTIGEYDATTGAPIGTGTLISSGLHGADAIAVETQAAPEPSTWAMLLGGLGVLTFLRRRALRTY